MNKLILISVAILVLSAVGIYASLPSIQHYEYEHQVVYTQTTSGTVTKAHEYSCVEFIGKIAYWRYCSQYTVQASNGYTFDVSNTYCLDHLNVNEGQNVTVVIDTLRNGEVDYSSSAVSC